MKKIDHEKLLIKYIAYVMDCEGEDYIEIFNDVHARRYLDKGDKKELERLAELAQELRGA